jgi:hypothetical protein
MPQTGLQRAGLVASSLFSSLLRRKMSVLGFYPTTLDQLLISSALLCSSRQGTACRPSANTSSNREG